MHRVGVKLLSCGMVLLSTSCVAPARNFKDYEGKAAAAAGEALSAVETARVAVVMADKNRAMKSYLDVVLSESEEQAVSAQGAFDAAQPPGKSSDKLRDELDEMLQQAASVLAELRIAARRGELDSLVPKARPLGRVSKQLREFYEGHS